MNDVSIEPRTRTNDRINDSPGCALLLVGLLLLTLLAACGRQKPDINKMRTDQFRYEQLIKDSNALKTALARLRHPSPKAIIEMVGDTIEITPQNMLFIRVAGDLMQVERDGKWMRHVDEGTVDTRRGMAYVELDSLKVNPYYFNKERQASMVWVDSEGIANPIPFPGPYSKTDSVDYFRTAEITPP